MPHNQWALNMKEKKLPELDILRIISILIVVIVIHFPTAYTYPFFIHYSPYQGFLFHTMGIHVSMGSFVFVSGFGLYLNKNYITNFLSSVLGIAYILELLQQ